MKRIYRNSDIEFKLKDYGFTFDLLEIDSVNLTFFTTDPSKGINKTKSDIKNGSLILDWKDLSELEEGILYYSYDVAVNDNRAVDKKLNKVDKILTDYLIMSGIVPAIPPEDANDYYTKPQIDNKLDTKQDVLVSGSNIKTINNQSILGKGNITIQGGTGVTTDYNALNNLPSINSISLKGNKTLDELGIQPKGDYLTEHQDISNKQDKLVSGVNIATINNQDITKGGNIDVSADTIHVKVNQQDAGTLNEFVQNIEDTGVQMLEMVVSKQDKLVSGVNIATINGNDLTQGGDITIEGAVTSVNGKKGVVNLSGRDINCQYDAITGSIGSIDEGFAFHQTNINGKQDKLVNGQNISSICGYDLTEGGNLELTGSDLYWEDGSDLTIEEQFDIVDFNKADKTDVDSKLSNKVDKVGGKGLSTNDYSNIDKTEVSKIKDKQDKLISGQNIKTINNQSILGKGNIVIEGGGGSAPSVNCNEKWRYEIPLGAGQALNNFTKDEDRIYWGGIASKIHCYSLSQQKELWVFNVTSSPSFSKCLLVKDDYLYSVSDNQFSIRKFDKITGEQIVSKSYSDIIGYGFETKNVLFVLNNNLYLWSVLTKTIYKVNESDLSLTECQFYKGKVALLDTIYDWGTIYTIDKEFVWFNSDLIETSKVVNKTSSLNVVDYIACSEGKVVFAANCIASPAMTALNSTGTNFSDTFVWTNLRYVKPKGLLNQGRSILFNNNTFGTLRQESTLLYPEKEIFIGNLPFDVNYIYYDSGDSWAITSPNKKNEVILMKL